MLEYVTFARQVAQGDLLSTRINELPAGLVAVATGPQGYVVAHSETGHHHVVVGPDGTTAGIRYLVTPDGNHFGDALVAYLEVTAEYAELRHLRGWDTHTTIRYAPGVYRLDRQQEIREVQGEPLWAVVQD